MPVSWWIQGKTLASRSWERFRSLVGGMRADETVRLLFATLALIDLAWIAWFGATRLLHETGVNEHLHSMRHLLITQDGSWPEYYDHVKKVFLVLLLCRLAYSTRQLVYLFDGVLYAVVLADDLFTLHEKWGGFIAYIYYIRPSFGLRDHDIGELFAWLVLGLALVPLGLLGFRFSRREDRENGLALLVPFALLVFCAVAVDQLYNIWHDLFFGAGILLDMLEDGGEMLAITLACGVTAVLVRRLAESRAAS